MTIGTIRLSQSEKDQLTTLKRRTGIKNWNTLCRLALCTSLREESDPPEVDLPADSNVEMSWSVFAGEYAELYLGLLKVRLSLSRRETASHELTALLRQHLHRGLGNLLGMRWNGISELPAIAKAII